MTVATTAPAALTQLDMGWVMSGTFRILARRALDILIVGAPFVLLPQMLAGFLPPELSRLGVVAGLPGIVFTGAICLVSYRDLSGGARVGASAAISRGLAKFGTLWGVGIISGLGIALGTLLLIVPGVILLAAWLPASTVVMAEDSTTTSALDRAWTLTKGSRWRIAGLSGLVLLIVLGLFLVLFGVTVGLGLTLGEETGLAVVTFGVAPLWTLLVLALTTVFPAAVYAGLRRSTEGSAGDVAQVFS